MPGNLIDPVAYKMLQFYSLPNMGVGTPEYVRVNNWIGSGVNKAGNDQWDLKIDHRFSDRDLLIARFSWGRLRSRGTSCFDNLADPCAGGQKLYNSRVSSLNHVHTFNPTTLLNLSYGFAPALNYGPGPAADYPDSDPVSTLGMPEYIKRSGVVSAPAIYIAGGYAQAGGISIGMSSWNVWKIAQETHHLLATLNSWQGSHDLKFRGEMRTHRVHHHQPGAAAGEFGFDFYITPQYPYWGGGDAMAGFLTGGGFGSEGYYQVPVAVSSQNLSYSGYFQDNWRVNDRLTLTLGMRYELDLPRTERFDRVSWIDPDVPSPLLVPGLSLRGGLIFADEDTRSPYDLDATNVGPRFGLAYRLKEKTVVRAG